MPFKKGNKLAGSRKGVKNRAHTEMGKALFEALHADEGAVEYFRGLKKKRAALFCNLLRAYVPKNIKLDAEITERVFRVRDLTGGGEGTDGAD